MLANLLKLWYKPNIMKVGIVSVSGISLYFYAYYWFKEGGG